MPDRTRSCRKGAYSAGPTFAPEFRPNRSSDTLAVREFEVLQLIGIWSANKQIAADLSVNESTAKTHVANIFQ
ncbi:MAG: hypothetical protein CL879_09775 [Dehalococcoidia bacterium]|nr:hypothetical protein [Dehalococcoidia bacterium]